MNEKNDLTNGNILTTLVKFALPYLLAAFMQTFYGMADLFVVGLYNDASTTTAVSIGSQVMHMITVIILGFAMGTTVNLGNAIGAKDKEKASSTVCSSIYLFIVIALAMTSILLISAKGITKIMLTPVESISQTNTYLFICFAGIPFIVAYNVISSVFRGAGDSTRPMWFVGIACVVNIILDFVFIGGLGLGAAGAALGTVLGQAVSVIISLFVIKQVDLGFEIKINKDKSQKELIKNILGVGTPIALQDGLIQVAFVVITIIANSRGLIAAASVGIVEKLICFMFLVPSAFLSAISAITAQNVGAGKLLRARKSLYYGLAITMTWGFLCTIYNQFLPHTLVSLFTRDAAVIVSGCEYMRSYCFDAFFAAVHFCFSGYFCGTKKSIVSFIHNIISIILIRIPFTYFFSKWWPDTLFPMGTAAPLGSLLSALICIGVFLYFKRKNEM